MISATFFGLPASTTQITGKAAVKVEKHLEAEMLELAILLQGGVQTCWPGSTQKDVTR